MTFTWLRRREDPEAPEPLYEPLASLLRERAQEPGAWPPRLADAAAFRDVSRHPARIKCALLSWTALRKALS
ncbi:hypothetical protein [Streptomyces sp. NPDC094147]|uniref:hypothetical protein n=1 Tax=Streptomyces sp. NPDC094147 TaxID=3366057 RepID=UPI00381449BF